MSEWIDAKDRKPPPAYKALVCLEGTECYGAAMWLGVEQDGLDRWFCLEGGEMLDWIPSHWMPFPAPPVVTLPDEAL